MASEAVFILARTNLVLGLAIAALLAVRALFRRHCGADVAYALWVAAPLAGLTALISNAWDNLLPSALYLIVPAWAPLLLGVWAGGAAVALILLIIGQARVREQVARGRFGPAVTGLITPRVYLPADFSERFDAGERAVIRAHERAHLMRHDALVTYGLALGQCLFWFNPLVHLGAVYLRRDQEMACDLTVMDERPETRGLYARTMLKAQLFGGSPQLGCNWARHPLEERVKALKETPSTHLRTLGLIGLGAGALAALVQFSLAIH